MKIGESADCGYIVGNVGKITMNMKAKSTRIRIIGGQWRGRKLPVLDSEGLRPTTDRVRETLFNWLMHDIAQANCLDLFAGTGVLGLECLSRGAKSVDFVEARRPVVDSLRANLATLIGSEAREPNGEVGNNEAPQALVFQQNALAFLNDRASKKYDLVFLDPPFKSNLLMQTIPLLHDKQLLKEGALVYIEQRVGTVVDVPNSWHLHRAGDAGQSRYQLYQA